MSLEQGQVVTGIVTRYSPKSGYGFIKVEGSDDVFIHQSDIDMDGFRSLYPDEEVEFTVDITNQGVKARAARLLSQRDPNARHQNNDNSQQPRGNQRPGGNSSDLGRALARCERLERQLKKLVEILSQDDGDGVVLDATDVHEIWTSGTAQAAQA